MKKRVLIWMLVAFIIGISFVGGYVALIEIGARRGSPDAQNELGRFYDLGLWLHFVNRDEAIYWYKKAAELDYAKAQYNLGLKLQEEGDYQQSAYWYFHAALQNFAPAQNNLAVLYSKGLGLSKNPKEAVRWFEKAAENGNPRAQYTLGIRYINGEDGPRDLEKGGYWIQKSASQDLAIAQGYLAIMYVKGIGVPANLDMAEYWAKRASGNGDVSAKKMVRLIEELKAH